jgi:hypothetical protein
MWRLGSTRTRCQAAIWARFAIVADVPLLLRLRLPLAARLKTRATVNGSHITREILIKDLNDDSLPPGAIFLGLGGSLP